jgi:hypothetical protein
LVTLAVWTSAPFASAGTPPATLTGESLLALPRPATVLCRTSGDFSYTASGVAAGPYFGTFTESGTVTVFQPPQAGTVGTVTAFSAAFTIYSASGDVLVRGTKSLDTTVPGSFLNACLNPPALGAGGFYAGYHATIYTPNGNYSDQGTSFIAVLFSDPSGTFLDEDFVSSLHEPGLIAPTEKNQCKNGDWENYPQFKNQGDCVSFVSTGGKNPPAGP